MTHGDAVGHGDGAKLPRRGAGRLDALSHSVGLAHQGGVAGRSLVPARCDAHEGLGDFAAAKAHGVIIGPMRRARWAFGHMTAGELRLVPASISLAMHWNNASQVQGRLPLACAAKSERGAFLRPIKWISLDFKACDCSADRYLCSARNQSFRTARP